MNRVREFHLATDQPVNVPFDIETFRFRGRLMIEEARELIEAIHDVRYMPNDSEMKQETLAHVMKEMADVVYVIYGTCIAFGWDFETAFDRICKNNMDKTVNVRKDSVTGKILKPAGYKPPNLRDIVV